MLSDIITMSWMVSLWKLNIISVMVIPTAGHAPRSSHESRQCRGKKSFTFSNTCARYHLSVSFVQIMDEAVCSQCKVKQSVSSSWSGTPTSGGSMTTCRCHLTGPTLDSMQSGCKLSEWTLLFITVWLWNGSIQFSLTEIILVSCHHRGEWAVSWHIST